MCVALAVGLFVPRAAWGQLCFAERSVDPAIDSPRGVAYGDLDGDGDIDLVGASSSTDTVAWYENDGAASPSFARHIVTTAADAVFVLSALDMDGDTDIDILTTGATASTIVWHENDGLAAPSFTQRTVSAVAAPVYSLVGADLDDDGDTDVVFRSQTSVGWCESDGATPPTFTVWTIASTPSFGSNAEVADMDGDTDLDVVATAATSPGQIRYWENDGASPPGFAVFQVIFPQVSGTTRVAVSDVDADGDADVVASGFVDPSTLILRLSDGANPPAFTPVTIATPLENPRCWGAQDVDGDGDVDLIALSDSLNTVAWLDSDGLAPPSFVFRAISSGVLFATCVIGADLDGDADIDIAAAAYVGDTIEWFERVDAEILETSVTYPLLGPAMDAATAGQTVLANPEHFAPALASGIDFQGKALTLESRGALVIPPGPVVQLADDALVRSAVGEPVIMDGGIELPSGASATIQGASVVIGGPIDLAPGSGVLTLDGPSGIMKGAPIFSTSLLPTPNAPGAGQVHCADFDGDGDPDLAAAMGSSLRYYENDLVGSTYLGSIVGTGSAINRVSACDIDGDDDLDLVSADQIGTVRIDWWENDGAHPPSFTRRLISSAYPNAVVCGADLDGDGDGDVVGAVAGGNTVKWFENTGGAPPSFVTRTLPGSPQFPRMVRAADIDGDNDIDIVVASQADDTIAWYENLGGPPATMFARRTISTLADGAADVFPADVDGDGDLDVISASSLDNTVAWHENSGTTPIVWVEHIVSTDVAGTTAACGADLDLDGDTDIVATASDANAIEWFESLGGAPPGFIQHTLAAGVYDPFAITASDLDLDEAIDVVTGTGTIQAIWIHRSILRRAVAVPAGATIAASGTLELVNRMLDVSGGAVAAAASVLSVDRTSRLSGGGNVDAPLTASAGTVSPDPESAIVLSGDYTQIFDAGSVGPLAGVLSIALGNGTVPAILDVAGEATLAGALRVSSTGVFAPSVGASFEILTANALTPGSRFATALLPNIGTHKFLSVVYDEGGARALASVSLQVNSLTGDVTLDPQAGADSGTNGVPKGATLGDIDLDGDPDLLIALPDALNPTTAPGSVVILYNADDGDPANGWEGFGDTLQVTTGVGVNPSSVAVGLLDADTEPDIVVSNRGAPGATGDDTVSVLLVSDPAPLTFTLSATPTVAVGDEPADVIIADLDGDGILDIITANAGSDSMSVAWNAGTGTGPLWSPPPASEVDLPDEDEVPVSVRPGDTNADAFAFIASANSGTNSIGLVQVNPDRSTVVLPSVPAGNAPVEVVVADFDLDGEDDIATVNRNSSSITLVLGETGPSATLAMGLPSELPIASTASAPRSIAAGDFDSDASGDIDLAILADGVVKVLRNDLFNGQLAFTPVPDQAAGTTPLLVRSADLNVDGRDDVVTIAESAGLIARSGTRSADSVNILLAAPEPCAGDVTGDGDTNVSDFNVVASNFGLAVAPNTNGDLTGDGLVNVSDFNIMAGDFGCITP